MLPIVLSTPLKSINLLIILCLFSVKNGDKVTTIWQCRLEREGIVKPYHHRVRESLAMCAGRLRSKLEWSMVVIGWVVGNQSKCEMVEILFYLHGFQGEKVEYFSNKPIFFETIIWKSKLLKYKRRKISYGSLSRKTHIFTILRSELLIILIFHY